MARFHQWVGLNKRAQNWLHQNRAILIDAISVDDAFSGEPAFQLNIYDTDIGFVEEFIQFEPWASGPNTMVALRTSCNKQPIEYSLWQENKKNYGEINAETGYYWL